MGRTKKNKTMDKIKVKVKIGTIYQTKVGGSFYLRYQINGVRKNINLNTSEQDAAIKKYESLLPTLTATDIELVAAQVSVARRLAGVSKTLCLEKAWEKYSLSPERATPSTVSEQQSYERTFEDFCSFINDPLREIHTITYEDAKKYTDMLKKNDCAVDTHNRKVKRLRKIFKVLHEYCGETPNPFSSITLQRTIREERDIGVRRLGFTHEQEQAILKELDNPKHLLLNKEEIKVIYYLGIYTGQRLKDCALLRWSKVDLNHGLINVEQFKTGKDVTIPIAPQLMQVLKQAIQWQTSDFSYVCPKVAERYNKTDKNGKNIGSNLVDVDVLRVIRWAGMEPSVKVPGRAKKITVYGFHSLRHSFASHCSESGIPRAVVQSILGDDCDILDQYYTHIGQEAQEKAIAAIAGGIGVLSPQERIDKALDYIKEIGESNEFVEKIQKILLGNSEN